MKAVVVDEVGGPERLTLAELPKPAAGTSDVVVNVAVSGVNFIEV